MVGGVARSRAGPRRTHSTATSHRINNLQNSAAWKLFSKISDILIMLMHSNASRPKYRSNLVPLASKLRYNSTLAEVLLWNKLKMGQMCGLQFHRQKPIGGYIVDFFCPSKMLIIEIDRCSHDYTDRDDVGRQRALESMGYRFLRFRDGEVRFKMDKVLTAIDSFVTRSSSSTAHKR